MNNKITDKHEFRVGDLVDFTAEHGDLTASQDKMLLSILTDIVILSVCSNSCTHQEVLVHSNNHYPTCLATLYKHMCPKGQRDNNRMRWQLALPVNIRAPYIHAECLSAL